MVDSVDHLLRRESGDKIKLVWVLWAVTALPLGNHLLLEG